MSENFNFNNSNETTTTSSIPSFSSFKNKDGSEPTQNKNFSNKKKNRIDEIIDKPITITAVNHRKSNYGDNKEYLVHYHFSFFVMLLGN